MRIKNILSNCRGMTLLEMIFSAAIMTLVMAGIYSTVIAVMANNKMMMAESELYADTNRILERIERGENGLAGLMKSGPSVVDVSADGNTIDFMVDQNAAFTTTTADDTSMSIYMDDPDGDPATWEDNAVMLDPDAAVDGDEMVLGSGVTDVAFAEANSVVTAVVSLRRSVRGQQIDTSVSKSIYLRNI